MTSTSTASFGVRRLLHRGRLALVLGGFALWLGTIAHTVCAVPLLPAGSSGTIGQVGTIDYTSALQHAASDSGAPFCQRLLDASTAAQSGAVLCRRDDRAADLLTASAPQPLIVRGDGWIVENYPRRLPPPGCPLYLRTLRLLIGFLCLDSGDCLGVGRIRMLPPRPAGVRHKHPAFPDTIAGVSRLAVLLAA